MNKFIDFSDFTVDDEKIYNSNSESRLIIDNSSYRNNNSNGLTQTRQNGSGTINEMIGQQVNPVLGIVNNLIGTVENIIVSCNEVRLEKEKTKQVQIQADIFITQSKEETKRIAIHEREETKRIKVQLVYDYKKFRASLFNIAREFELKNKELIESGRKFDMKMDIIKEPIKGLINDITNKNNMILKQWQQGKIVDENILMHIENLQNQLNQLMIELIRI